MKQQLKFYATNTQYTNRIFSFWVNDLEGAKRILSQFVSNGNHIKVAYWNVIHDSGRTQNFKLNISSPMWRKCLIPYLWQLEG